VYNLSIEFSQVSGFVNLLGVVIGKSIPSRQTCNANQVPGDEGRARVIMAWKKSEILGSMENILLPDWGETDN
jgi:hypothetical protein